MVRDRVCVPVVVSGAEGDCVCVAVSDLVLVSVAVTDAVLVSDAVVVWLAEKLAPKESEAVGVVEGVAKVDRVRVAVAL